MALNEFEGTVMLVSHDRALLRAVCDEFWLVSSGGIAPFDGDLDDYQRYLLDEAKRQREALKEASNSDAKAERKAQSAAKGKVKAAPDDSQRLLQRQLETVETRMAALNTEGAALEAQLCAAPPATEIAKLSKRLKSVNDELQTLEEQWLELSTKV